MNKRANLKIREGYEETEHANENEARPDTLYLERKPYIQPFEQILARAELAGLVPELGIDDPFSKAVDRYVTFSSLAPVNLLKRRLAYWQRLGTSKMELTDQVLIEGTEYFAANGLNASIPRHRNLRYGPHDIHEYRGKFFPQLVKSLINFSGIPDGSIVLDPFCGSGTTNIEARVAGMRSIGIDLNPLSVLIAKVKTTILDVDHKFLRVQTDKYYKVLDKTPVPDGLSAIENRFTNEDIDYLVRWFDKAALLEIVKILNSIDSVKHPILKDFFRVSLSNIVRSVSWQKGDDLRVRKEITKYVKGTALKEFKAEVERQLEKIIPYLSTLHHLESLSPFPEFVIQEADTRQIDQHFEAWAGQCDLLITSPPYATALPYLDTDRLSLILLGMLTRKEHRGKETLMIGNREVLESHRKMLWETYQKRRSDLPPMTSKFIDDLAKDYHSDKVGFRRRNLPALLASYFLDMRDSMESARKMMKPGSYGFWVVGNNSTNVDGERVEICTDKYLWEIGKKVGWMQEGIIDMELLPSRDIFRNNRGTAERILIFRSSPPRSAVYSDVNSKQHVNGSDWDFHGENTQQHLHALHPYPARFIPQIPRKAILDYTKRGDLVLDPFCGCGTTLLESSLLGRRSIGVDNNAVAALITQAKIATYRKKDLAVLKQFADKFTGSVSRLTKSSSVPEYDSINYWFDENAISDFGKIRYIVNKLPQPARTFALAVFSSLIVRFSYQDSDTRYCRIERKYKPGSAIKAFQTKILDNVNRLSEIINKEKAEAHVHLGDTRDLSFISPSSVSLIITSPPYLNAYDYHKYHRHRLHWIDGDIAYARDNEIGKHDTFTRPKATPDRYFREMEQSFMQWRRALKPGGKVLIVIGDSIVSGRPVTVADEFIKIMKSLHFVLESRWTRNLQTTKKSFNQKARIDQEHVLLFIKSD